MRLIGTKIVKGMGLGNMLFTYVSVRALAKELGAEFAILGKELMQKALADGTQDSAPFLELDYGISASESDFQTTVTEHEDRLFLGNSTHDLTIGCYVSPEDPSLHEIDPEGGVLIMGNLQAEGYFRACLKELPGWLAPRKECPSPVPAMENLCLINIRGGEYTGSPELFLRRKYYRDAMARMKKERPDMEFLVITDDFAAAERILPEVLPKHFSTMGDYLALRSARYLILSNSSFGFFPSYTNENAALILAPKFWARHNVSDGYWSGEQNIYDRFLYLDRSGQLFTPEECRKELADYKQRSPKFKRLNTPLTGPALSLGHIQAKLVRASDMWIRANISLGRRLGIFTKRSRRRMLWFLVSILLTAGIAALTLYLTRLSIPVNPAPELIPSVSSWKEGRGLFTLTAETPILADEGCLEAAGLLRDELAQLGFSLPVRALTKDSPLPSALTAFIKEGSIILTLHPEKASHVPDYEQDESYRILLDRSVRVEASTRRGLVWGVRTLSQLALLCAPENEDALTIPLPRGTITDAPAYPVRSISLDAARKPVSMDALLRLLERMSAYRLNELSLHLNDNEILAYSGLENIADADSLYAAYRLESSLTSESGERYTSEDLFYTKEEFRKLVEQAAALGIRIVPEIDTPAHSLAFTAKSPALGLPVLGAVDQFNLLDPRVWEFIDSLWAEQEDSFSGCPILHIGGDEYYGNPDEYLGFLNYNIQQREKAGKTVRFWGSLSRLTGSGAVPLPAALSEAGLRRQMVIWNTWWADPRAMAELGFSLINANHSELYIIPGSGQDRLEKEEFYSSFRVCRFPLDEFAGEAPTESILLPKERLLGAQLALWNDFTGNIENGMGEEDMLDRLYEAIPYLAQKTWCEETELSFEEFENLERRLDEIRDWK